jgi:hypothetical protein|tara:strand:- start:289 stop:468 length:180 start_codon:yes stop_codon:yes gene_type:complete
MKLIHEESEQLIKEDFEQLIKWNVKRRAVKTLITLTTILVVFLWIVIFIGTIVNTRGLL